MNRFLPLAFILILVHFTVFGQEDHVGSGHAIRFDAIDDYIDLGNIYDDLYLPLTVSAWVYLEPSEEYILPVFASQDNAALYNGFWFCFSATNLLVEYGDGRGDNNSAFRKGKSAPVNNLLGRWIYVTAVVKNSSDIQLYSNGFNVGGAATGNSDQPMASNYPGDVAKIGYLFTNSVTHNFKGIMDELRIWNRSLSQDEIRESMCHKLKGNETGLIGYWTFDETDGDVLKDLSSNHFDGQLKGNPTRVFSGAPIGDESVFLYPTDWVGKSLDMDDLSVVNITGSPYGVHVYKVNQNPSQTNGLDVATLQPPYYGIFLAGDDNNSEFELSFAMDNVCAPFQRTDNSISTWNKADLHSRFPERMELIPSYEEGGLQVSLGPDTTICNKTSFLLESNLGSGFDSFVWSTGQTSTDISVTSSGKYSLEVKKGCLRQTDTIMVSFLEEPPAFSFGEDQIACQLEKTTLDPGFENGTFDFTWQDGSKEKTFQVVDFGTYWLTVKNACGSSADSINIFRKILKDFKSYNFISPNEDDADQYFILDPLLLGSRLDVFNRWGKLVYHSASYQNEWDGLALPAGIYFYLVHGACFEDQKGTVTISR